jgi:hypothetical protein
LKLRHSFHFHHTHPAAAYNLQSGMVAVIGDLYAVSKSSIQDSCPGGYFNFAIINL